MPSTATSLSPGSDRFSEPLGVTLCPRCLEPKLLRDSTPGACAKCPTAITAERTITCPSSECQQSFEFYWRLQFPHCGRRLENADPLSPVPPPKSAFDFLFAHRREALENRRIQLEQDLTAFRESWLRDTTGGTSVVI